MLQRLMDDVRAGVGSSLRSTGLAMAFAAALLVALGFFCAALFIFIQQQEGTVKACLALGGLFVVMALLAGGCYLYKQRRDRRRLAQAAKQAKSTTSTLLSDPTVLAIGLQVVRLVGVRRLIPLLAIGGVALGLMAGRNDRREPPAE